jgi:hypothetical protein
MGTMNTIEVANVITWVISDIMQSSHKVIVSHKRGHQSVFTISHQGHQSVFTIGLSGRQNVVTIGCHGHTKAMTDSHMSQKLHKLSLAISLACQKLPRDKVACLAGSEDEPFALDDVC